MVKKISESVFNKLVDWSNGNAFFGLLIDAAVTILVMPPNDSPPITEISTL